MRKDTFWAYKYRPEALKMGFKKFSCRVEMTKPKGPCCGKLPDGRNSGDWVKVKLVEVK